MERDEVPTPATKRTRLVRVDQKIIDLMLKERPYRPTLPVFSDMPGLGATMARAAVVYKRCNDLDADILRQYRDTGYAFVEVEVSDDDEDEEVAAAPVERSMSIVDEPARRNM